MVVGRQTKATHIAAEVARLNAQAVINAERPWITIFGVRDPQRGCRFRASNLGRIPAEIVSFSADSICVENIAQIPEVPKYGTEHSPTIKLLIPGNKLGEPGYRDSVLSGL